MATIVYVDQFKYDLLQAIHDWDTDVLKVANFTSSATFGVTSTAYSTTNEVSGTGYTAGGVTVAGTATKGTTSYFDLVDAAWTTTTQTFRYSVLYNSSKSNKIIGYIDWGSDQTVSAGNLTIQWPANDATNAILRIA